MPAPDDPPAAGRPLGAVDVEGVPLAPARPPACARRIGQASLGLGEEPGFELELAELAAALVGHRLAAQRALELSEAIQRPRRSPPRLVEILAREVLRRVGHLACRLAQLTAARLLLAVARRRLLASTLRSAARLLTTLLAALLTGLLTGLLTRLLTGLLATLLTALLSVLLPRLVLRRLLAVALHLLRQLLGLAAKLLLLLGEALELPFQLLGRHRGASPGQLALLLGELVLAARQRLHALERVVLLVGAVLAAARGVAVLVVGLLLPHQLFVEERRQILVAGAAAAAPAAAALPGHLTLGLLGGELEQLVVGRHLVRHGVVRLEGPERRFRLGHRSGGTRQRRRHRRIRRRRHPLGSAATRRRAAGLRRKRLGPGPQLALGLGDRAHVRRRLAGDGAPLQLPRRDDDLLLRLEEIGGRAGAAAAHAGLALGGEERLAERPHLEEEDIAPRLGRDLPAADVAGARVVGDEVAGLDGELLDEQRVQPVDARRRQPPAPLERHDLLAAPPHRVDELEVGDAVIVVGARLDDDFLELRDLAIARGPHDADVGRPVVEHAHEVLGIVRALEPVDVLEADAIRPVLGDREPRRERGGVAAAGERERGPVLERHRAAANRLVGVHRDPHRGAGRPEDVAAVLVVARRQLGEARERVVEIDPRDPRRVDRRDLVLGRGERAGDDAIAEVGLDLRPVDDVAVAVAPHRLRHRVGGRDHERRDVGRGARGQTVDAGADAKRRAARDADVAGRHRDGEPRRRDVQAGRLHGAPRGGPRHGERDREHHERRRGPAQGAPHRVAGDDALGPDLGKAGRGGAHEEAVERAGLGGVEPLGRRDHHVVELAVLLLGEARQLAVARRAAKRRLQPDDGGDRGGDGGREEADERQAGRRRRAIDGPRGAGDQRHRRGGPGRDAKAGQRAPALAQAVEPRA